MGCFGYICPKCNTQIVGNCFTGGEACVLIHVRHGKELGRTVGHYNEYGTTIEAGKDKGPLAFRNENKNNPNSHDNICDSEFDLDDSMCFGYKRTYKNKEINIREQHTMLEFIEDQITDETTRKHFNTLRTSTPASEAFNDALRQILDASNLDKKDKKYLTSKVNTRGLTEVLYDLVELLSIVNYIGEFEKLPISSNVKSGMIAYHLKCYNELPSQKLEDLEFSKADPDQSWGEVRAQYL